MCVITSSLYCSVSFLNSVLLGSLGHGHLHSNVTFVIVILHTLVHANIGDNSNKEGDSNTSGSEPPDGETVIVRLVVVDYWVLSLWINTVLWNNEGLSHGWFIDNDTILKLIGI